MRCWLVALMIPASLPEPARQEPSEAEQVFKKMEKQLAAAKTLQFQFETTLEGGLAKGAQVKGSFVLAGNRMRIAIEGDFEGKAMKGEMVSDGTTMRAVASFDGKPSKPRDHDTPDNLGRILKTMTGRTGIFFALEAVEHVVAPMKDKSKPIVPEKLFAVSDFKAGAKEKVGAREAQLVHYTMVLAGSPLVAHVTVWIDTETHLPLKRTITDKKGKKGFEVTETYSGFQIDETVSAKTFQLPK